jgi:signal transduction histidine kinase
VQLQKRLTLFTLALITIISLSLGITLIETSHRDALQRTDNALVSIKKSVDESTSDKLTTALTLVRTSPISPILILLDESFESTVIFDPADEEKEINLAGVVISTSGRIENIPKGYRATNNLIEGDSVLLILKSVSDLDSQRTTNYLYLFIFTLISIVLSQLILRKLISRDISRESETIRLQEKLNYETDKRKLLLDFISDASHELRTPLTIIKGYLSLANRKSKVTDSEILGKLNEESARLEKNIDSLLTVLEFESLPENLMEPIDLSRLVSNEFNSFRRFEHSRETEIYVTEGIFVRASEELILKLVRNALLNVSRHAPKDAKALLKLERTPRGAAISIEDSGPLNGDQNLQIEDYVQRFNSKRSLEKGGSGLGFSIMNSAIKKIGGHLIIFKSELGGFGVNIEFPISNGSQVKN